MATSPQPVENPTVFGAATNEANAELLKEAGIKKGSSNSKTTKVGHISKDQLKKNINKTYNCLIKHINGVAVGITDGGREIYIPNYRFNNENYFNPSALYSGGLSCAREIRNAKESILRFLRATNHEVIFTSCGSESDNLAIFGSVKRGTFVTSKGEHSAVYKSFLELKNPYMSCYAKKN